MSTNDQKLTTRSTAAIATEVRKILPITLSGDVKGIVWKSPSSVLHIEAFKKIKAYWSYKFVFRRNSRNSIAQYNHGVYLDDKHFFPSVCVECGKDFDHIEILEVGIPVQTVSRKLRLNTSQEEANRIFFAWQNCRVWYPIPYCKDHHLKNQKSIFNKSSGGKNDIPSEITLYFANPEVGKEFGVLNNLRGVWHQPTPIGNVEFNSPEEVRSLPKNWWLKTALQRIPFYLIAAFLFMLMMWGCSDFDGNLNLDTPQEIFSVLAFIGMIIFGIIPQWIGHYPAGNRPKKGKEKES